MAAKDQVMTLRRVQGWFEFIWLSTRPQRVTGKWRGRVSWAISLVIGWGGGRGGGNAGSRSGDWIRRTRWFSSGQWRKWHDTAFLPSSPRLESIIIESMTRRAVNARQWRGALSIIAFKPIDNWIIEPNQGAWWKGGRVWLLTDSIRLIYISGQAPVCVGFLSIRVGQNQTEKKHNASVFQIFSIRAWYGKLESISWW